MPAQQGAGAGTGANGARGSSAADPAARGRSSGQLETAQVRAMFDRIAGVYDLMNTAMTAGLHHRWRARAADLVGVGPGNRVLDVATGTGDLAVELARRIVPGGEVVGSDFAEAMLVRAREKARSLDIRSGNRGSAGDSGLNGDRAGLGTLRFEWGDAMELPYEDDSFDAATVGFGARNFADLGRGLAEMVRVVRPGGRVVVLEITTPAKPPLSLFFRLWFDRIVPVLGRLADSIAALGSRSRDSAPGATIAAAYTYLPNSVRRFPPPAALAAEMERAGLSGISYLLTAGGIIAIHAGSVPAEVHT
jgi:demethylmenaquinone methyltransferase / 2-methoxy-6-polyprenyl-1,4-benzoquinol methylase